MCNPVHVRVKAWVMASVTNYFARVGTEEYQSSLFKPSTWLPRLQGRVGSLPGRRLHHRSTSETTYMISMLWQFYQWTATARSYLHGEWTGSTPWIPPSASVPLFSCSLHPLIGLPQRTYRGGCFARASWWSRRLGKDPTRPCKRGSHIRHTKNLHSSSIT